MREFLLILIIVFGASSAIAGPELDNNSFKWTKSDRPSLPYTTTYHHSYKQLVEACKNAGVVNKRRFSLLFGCAQYSVDEGWCKVHIGPNDQDNTLAHEVRHCQGWDHK